MNATRWLCIALLVPKSWASAAELRHEYFDKEAGGQFDRFGLVTPWIDGNGQHVYFDDLSYTWRQE